MSNQRKSLKALLQDPASFFGHPDAVVEAPDLAASDKRQILEAWAFDIDREEAEGGELLAPRAEVRAALESMVSFPADRIRETSHAGGPEGSSGTRSPHISTRGSPMTHTPARRLVEAFGDCGTMAGMYAHDVTWRLNHSLSPNIAGPHVGKDAVCGFNDAVFNKIYEPGALSVEILDELGDETSSAVRFNFHARSRRGHSYDVEYVLFAKTNSEGICEVVELLDTHASIEQHAGRAVGVPPSSGEQP